MAAGAQRLFLQQTTDPEARNREMKKLADLDLRLSIEQEARRKFSRMSRTTARMFEAPALSSFHV